MTAEELEERQKWPLAQKIDHTLATIDQFVGRCEGKVFVSFSGGKDSTVLLDLCRIIRPDILAVFSNTGVEFPEIVKFVRDKIKAGENIQIIRPKLTPKQVWEKYGFPLISKETAQKIHRCRVNPDSKSAIEWLGDGFFSIAKRWRYLLSEAYETSDRCCAKLKKEPFHRYCAETGLNPIIGVMASESAMRKGQYLRNGGCNAFEGGKTGVSRPLSIWMEQDIWDYIKMRNLPIAEIYHKGAHRTGCVGCGFGCTFPDDKRFELLLETHPKLYELMMGYTNNGISYREALRKAFAIVGRHLPDEEPINLFTYQND